MIKAILNGILSLVSMLVNFILTPVNLLISTLFPDLSTSISNFSYTITRYMETYIPWCLNLLPPRFLDLLMIWLGFVCGYYAVYYTYIGIVKLFNVIQKIKFW